MLEWVVFGNIWLAFGAVLLSLQTKTALGQGLTLHPYWGFVFFGAWSLYGFHNLITLRLGGETAFQSTRWVFIRSRQSLWKGIAVGAFLVSAGFFAFLPWTLKKLLIWPGVLSLLYLAPALPGRKRLRDIPWAKSLTIALVWACLTGWIPAGYGNDLLPFTSLISLTAERFFFVLGLALPFDIRDKEQDLRLGMDTLPVRIGDRSVRTLALIALGLSAALVFWNLHQLRYSGLIACAIWISLIVSGFMIRNTKVERPEWAYSLGMDGMLILQPALVFIAGRLS